MYEINHSKKTNECTCTSVMYLDGFSVTQKRMGMYIGCERFHAYEVNDEAV